MREDGSNDGPVRLVPMPVGWVPDREHWHPPGSRQAREKQIEQLPAMLAQARADERSHVRVLRVEPSELGAFLPNGYPDPQELKGIARTAFDRCVELGSSPALQYWEERGASGYEIVTHIPSPNPA